MTKFSDLIKNYTANINLKAKLKKRITIDNGTVLKKGTVSDLLIDMGDGKYHFEANQTACTVTADEIIMVSKNGY